MSQRHLDRPLTRAGLRLRRRAIVVSSCMFLLLMGGAVAVWYYGHERDSSALQLQSNATAQQMASRLRGYLDVRVRVLEQIRREWNAGYLETREVFTAEATALQKQFPGFQAINWIDQEGVIQWVSPQVPNLQAEGKNVRNHPEAAASFVHAEQYGDVVMTPPLELFQGGTGFATYFPLIRDGHLEGYLNGVFRTTPLIEDCFANDMDGYFTYTVGDDEEPIYASSGAESGVAQFGARADVYVLGRTWQLRVRPTPAYVSASLGGRHALQIAFMSVLATALSAALYLLLVHHARLRLNEAELDRAQEIAQLGHWHWDVRDNVLTWSQRAHGIFGVSPDTFGGTYESFIDVVHPDDRSTVEAAVSAALYEGAEPAIDHRIARPDGSIGWVHEQGQVELDDAGEPVYMHGTVQDITERKESEEVLRESEERYRLLTDKARDTIWSVNLEGKLTYVSPAVVNFLGFEAEELIGTDLMDILPEQTQQIVHQMIGEAQAGLRNEVRIPVEIFTKDGECAWAEVNVTFVRDDEGNFAGMQGISRDIRDSKKAEEILQRRAQYESLISEVSTGFINCAPEDIDEAITAVLGYVCEFIGVERANLVLLDEAQKRAHVAYMWAAPGVTPSAHVGMEIASDSLAWLTERLKKNGLIVVNGPEDFPAEAQAERLRMEAVGYSSYTCVALHSGTQMLGSLSLATTGAPKTWPEDTLGLLRSVGHIIVNALERKRSDEIERRLENQLRQAQKMEAVGTLAGGIAHDFNNLLTGILGSLELALLDMDETSRLSDDLRNARTAAQRGADLTRQLLTLSRQQPSAFASTDIAAVVQSTMQLLERTLPETIQVSVDVQSEIAPIRADRNQLEQALLNLGINARDAMEAGGELTLRVRQVSLSAHEVADIPQGRPGDFVMIEVSDTGVGIPADILERIFEPFFTTKPVGQGTGLGLAMVYGCAEGHEGWVTAQSSDRNGASFRIYLPQVPFESGKVLMGFDSATEAASGSGTVLLVDDSPGVRATGQRLLERLGYNVLMAKNAEEGLGLLASTQDEIACVITDLVMPGMSGSEFLAAIRNRAGSMPVIAMSGYAAGANPDEILSEGFAELVSKPFSMTTLATTVRSVLDSCHATATAR